MSEQKQQIRLLGFVKIAGQIEAVTGLHIGGTADSIDKGGIDTPVIKNPVTNEPYIPGSSLRGRMRSLLEIKNGRKLTKMTENIFLEIYKTEDYEKEACFTPEEFKDFLTEFSNEKDLNLPDTGLIKIKEVKDKIEKKTLEALNKNAKLRAYKLALKSPVCRVFGNSASDPGLPSVLIVRDALLSNNSDEDYVKENYMKDGLPVTEAKMEIVVDRITAQAMPRTIERVPAGAKFDFELIYKVQTFGKWEDKNDDEKKIFNKTLKEDLQNILCALEMIEKYTGLGGNTSRGHGQVKFNYTDLLPCSIDKESIEVKYETPKTFNYKGFNDAVDSISFTIKPPKSS